jgi:hypothetical protein
MDFLKKSLGFVAGFVIVYAAIHFIGGRDKLKEFESYRSDDGNFTILFPGEPAKEMQSVNTLAGKIDFVMYRAGSKKSGFVVGYCDYPQEVIKDSNPKKMLDGAMDGAAGNVRGKIVKEMELDFHGYPGREIEIKLPRNTTIRARLILINNRLYQMMVISPSADILEEKGTKFLDSFSVNSFGGGK